MSAVLRRMAQRLGWGAQALHFARDRQGGVAMIFAFVLVPLLMVVFAAIDYSRAASAKTQLMMAADQAALSMVTTAAMAMSDNEAVANAKILFAAMAANVKFVDAMSVQVNATSDSKSQRTASVQFSAVVQSSVKGLFNLTSMPVNGLSKAGGTPPLYVDFYMLLDNSPSMGVAATTADIAKMVAGTPDQCAFACHDLSAGGKDYYALAKTLGVTTRIDVVRTATQQLMDTASSSQNVSGQFRAGVYTLGTVCSGAGLTTVASLSSSLDSVKTSAGAVDLMAVPYQNYNNDQCTDYDGAFAAMNVLVPHPGDGTKANKPQKVVFFVADGVSDAFYPATCSKPTTGGRCQAPINVANCTALKNRGIKVAVLYTTYLPLPTNGWYNTWIAPFASQINPAMASCASPGLFFEVSPSQGIAEAMAALFQAAVASAKISQ